MSLILLYLKYQNTFFWRWQQVKTLIKQINKTQTWDNLEAIQDTLKDIIMLCTLLASVTLGYFIFI